MTGEQVTAGDGVRRTRGFVRGHFLGSPAPLLTCLLLYSDFCRNGANGTPEKLFNGIVAAWGTRAIQAVLFVSREIADPQFVIYVADVNTFGVFVTDGYHIAGEASRLPDPGICGTSCR